jgi:hypothetical protein
MTLPRPLARVLGWLRSGYPDGVPETDYVPLFALLGSQLTDDDVTAIATELAIDSDPASASAIRAAITTVTSRQQPTDADINRVRARLAAGGWPLAQPEHIS